MFQAVVDGIPTKFEDWAVSFKEGGVTSKMLAGKFANVWSTGSGVLHVGKWGLWLREGGDNEAGNSEEKDWWWEFHC